MQDPTRYLAAQTLLLAVSVSIALPLHRHLVRTPRFQQLLQRYGGPSSQWLVVFPIVGLLYYGMADVVLLNSPQHSLPSLIPCGIGAAFILLAKNAVYALLQRRPRLELWDAGSFALLLGFVASWMLGSQVLALRQWFLWLALNEALIALLILLIARVFPLPAAPAETAPASKPRKRPRS